MTPSQTPQESAEAHAREAFSYLVDDFDATLTVKNQAQETVLAYVLPDAFFEVEMDWQEQTAFLLVGTPVNGSPPKGYYVDPEGHRVRWHLGAVLAQNGSWAKLERRLEAVQRESGPEAMTTQIDAFAAAAREVLAGLPSALADLVASGPARPR